MGTFEIKNSFDEVVQLVDSGDKKKVTKENLGKFIELAKDSRIHEFDSCLLKLKIGFDMIMSYKKNIYFIIYYIIYFTKFFLGSRKKKKKNIIHIA